MDANEQNTSDRLAMPDSHAEKGLWGARWPIVKFIMFMIAFFAVLAVLWFAWAALTGEEQGLRGVPTGPQINIGGGR